MALFEPTNNAVTGGNGITFINVNRYRSDTNERSGFLPSAGNQNVQASNAGPAVVRSGADDTRNHLLTLNTTNTSPASASLRGIDIYRRNNETNRRNTGASGNAATYRRTFTGALTQQQAKAASMAAETGFAQTPPELSSASSRISSAVEQYRSLQLTVNTTNDLLQRGLDVYQQTRRLAPALLESGLKNTGDNTQFGIGIPPTLNTVRSTGIAEYLIMNAPADKNTNPYDLYLKAGPKRLLETQLFI